MKPGYVTLRSTAPNLTVTCLLGADGARVTGGYGGWVDVPRPRRLALTQWDGRSPFEMAVQLVLDAHADDGSVEAQCSALERMALPPRSLAEPPVITITGPVPHDDLTWVVLGLDWGSAMRNEDGNRSRQEVTVTLKRYVADDRLQLRPAAERAREKGLGGGGGTNSPAAKTPGKRTYVVKAGDTLSEIAARKDIYGNASMWPKIAQANGIRDPRNLRVGQVLRIP